MRTLATFRLAGDSGRTAAHVTERLGLDPTSSIEAGEPIGRTGPLRRTEASLWSLTSSDYPEDDVELASALHRLLDQLEPLAERLWELVRSGYRANWFCYVGSRALEHAVELDRSRWAGCCRCPATCGWTSTQRMRRRRDGLRRIFGAWAMKSPRRLAAGQLIRADLSLLMPIADTMPPAMSRIAQVMTAIRKPWLNATGSL